MVAVSVSSTSTAPESSRRLLTADEVALILRVTDRTVRRWANQGRLERIKLGDRLVRFTVESVEALIRPEHTETPAAEAEVSLGQGGIHAANPVTG